MFFDQLARNMNIGQHSFVLPPEAEVMAISQKPTIIQVSNFGQMSLSDLEIS